MWPIFVLTALAANPTGDCCAGEQQTITKPNQAGTLVADSDNFEVRCHAGSCDAQLVAQRCEEWREHLCRKWLGDADAADWSPRCTVVVHARRETYLSAVGSGAIRSFGSSWIDIQNRKVAVRRIDLLIDAQGRIAALGHELTHVVIADAFPDKPPPSWAGEGMALLADSETKRAAHARDAAAAHAVRRSFRCAELLALDGYPTADRIPAFYGQSAALVAALTEVAEPRLFVDFLLAAETKGYDQALRETYDIAGVSELEQLAQGAAPRSRSSKKRLAASEPAGGDAVGQ